MTALTEIGSHGSQVGGNNWNGIMLMVAIYDPIGANPPNVDTNGTRRQCHKKMQEV